MLGKFTSALILGACASIAFADLPGSSPSITYAIENPLRPGARAPHCPAQQPVIDGCTFHSVAGETYDASLQVAPGETWVASTPNATTVTFQAIVDRQPVNGQSRQVIRIMPNPSVNADTTVTFDRITGRPGSQKVIERRRINVMIHPA